MYLKGKALSMINSTYTVQTESGGFHVYLLSKTGKLGKCNCSSCPVHMMSECVEEKRMKAMKMMPKIKETKMMPEPEMVPGMYCVNGKATCTDIDTKQMCQCNICLLWKEFDLPHGEPTGYYCRDGTAKIESINS